ncbi:MAG: DNA gyrase inhibitor YacG [Alphaproteobacteria bacterium]
MAKCPQCKKKEVVEKYKPFCSKRCADLDLGSWFNGAYTIAVVENDMDFDDALEQQFNQKKDSEPSLN